MSMQLSVYVGPFIWTRTKNDELIDKHSAIVTEGRGELACDEAGQFVIPNAKLPGITRPLAFDKYSHSPALSLRNDTGEMAAFEELAKPFTDDLKAAGIEYSMTWGVVCGMQ